VDDNNDDEEEEEEEEDLCYQMLPRWKLPQRKQVLKDAKLIITSTLSVLSENDKGPMEELTTFTNRESVRMSNE
jgi:hypothetical protein